MFTKENFSAALHFVVFGARQPACLSFVPMFPWKWTVNPDEATCPLCKDWISRNRWQGR